MIRLFPFIFILIWSSAFITTKPIVDNSDPFAALAFRFLIVAIGFYIFSLLNRQKLCGQNKHILQSIFSGVLFHGIYLGGVFYSLFRTLLRIGKAVLKSSPKIIKSTARSPLGRKLLKSAKKSH